MLRFSFCPNRPLRFWRRQIASHLGSSVIATLVYFSAGFALAQNDTAQNETTQSETTQSDTTPTTQASDPNSRTVEPIAERGRLISDQAQASLIVNVTIGASVPGEIARVDVKEGQSIGLGDSLVRLDDELARAELVATQRAFEGAELQASNDVDARFAKRSLDVRVREYEQSVAANRKYAGTVSETELDKLRLEVDQSRLGIEQAEHEQQVAQAMAGEKQAAVDSAAVRLRKHVVIAPHQAQVAELFVQVGQRVDAGEPVVRLIDLDSLKIECLVDAELASKTTAGDRVEFHFDYDQMCEGQIEFVSSEIQPVTGQVRILATVQNPAQKLRPGTRGRLMAVKTGDSSDQ